jgi:hypothetical protein
MRARCSLTNAVSFATTQRLRRRPQAEAAAQASFSQREPSRRRLTDFALQCTLQYKALSSFDARPRPRARRHHRDPHPDGARHRVPRLRAGDGGGNRPAGTARGRAQALWLPDPASDVFGYIALWAATAALSIILVAVEMVARTRRIHRGLADEMIHAAIEAFMPAGVAGALLTVVIYRFAPQSASMLPGLWQILFSLGVFASCRSLPAPIFAAAVWYLAAGLGNLAFAAGDHAYAPWTMAVPFGAGQAFIAVVLYRSIGTNDAAA